MDGDGGSLAFDLLYCLIYFLEIIATAAALSYLINCLFRNGE